MKSTDVAVIKFTSENGRELTGVVAKVTEDVPTTRRILDWTRISIDRGLEPLKVHDPETIGLSFVQLENVLAIFVEDQQAIRDVVARWHDESAGPKS